MKLGQNFVNYFVLFWGNGVSRKMLLIFADLQYGRYCIGHLARVEFFSRFYPPTQYLPLCIHNWPKNSHQGAPTPISLKKLLPRPISQWKINLSLFVKKRKINQYKYHQFYLSFVPIQIRFASQAPVYYCYFYAIMKKFPCKHCKYVILHYI